MIAPQFQPAATADQATDSRPAMSRTEASWHEVIAGQRAAAAARAQDQGGEAMDAVAEVTAEPVRVGPYTLAPASPGTVAALRRMAVALTQRFPALVGPAKTQTDAEFDALQEALTLLTMTEPRRVLRQLGEPDGLERLLLEADDLYWSGTLTPGEFAQVDTHATRQLELLTQARGSVAAKADAPAAPAAPLGK